MPAYYATPLRFHVVSDENLEKVLENYNDYIFHECQKYLCNLGHKKVLESQMGIDLFSSSGYKEYIASVQNNQLVIV